MQYKETTSSLLRRVLTRHVIVLFSLYFLEPRQELLYVSVKKLLNGCNI